MTHQKRDRLAYAVGGFFKAVNLTPGGHELIQAKIRELIKLGVIKEGGTDGKNDA